MGTLLPFEYIFCRVLFLYLSLTTEPLPNKNQIFTPSLLAIQVHDNIIMQNFEIPKLILQLAIQVANECIEIGKSAFCVQWKIIFVFISYVQ